MDRLKIFTDDEAAQLLDLKEKEQFYFTKYMEKQKKILNFADQDISEFEGAEELIQNATTDTIGPTIKKILDNASAESGKLFDLYDKCSIEINGIYAAAEQRYIDSLAGNMELIIDDAKKVLSYATVEDFERTAAKLEHYSALIAKKNNENNKYSLKRTYSSYRQYLLQEVGLQLNAIAYYNLSYREIEKLINDTAAAAYEPTVSELEKQKPLDAETVKLTEKQELDILRTNRPDNLVSINDAASNILFNPLKQNESIKECMENEELSKFMEYESGQIGFSKLVKVGTKGKAEIKNVLSVWYDNDDNVKFTKNNNPIVLNDYDRAVFNGIITLYLSGTTAFTLPMLYGAMTGKESNYVTITDKIKSELLKALNKLERTKVELDYEKEKDNYTFNINGNEITLHSFKETVINIGEAEIIINGQRVKAYIINSKPQLLSYAEAKKQILSTPVKALELGIGLKNTPEVIALRQFIIDEIARMKGPNQSKHITYEAIYDRLAYISDAELSSKGIEKAKARTRSSALNILESFKKTGYIKDYKEVKQGKAYHHLEITIDNPQSR